MDGDGAGKFSDLGDIALGLYGGSAITLGSGKVGGGVTDSGMIGTSGVFSAGVAGIGWR